MNNLSRTKVYTTLVYDSSGTLTHTESYDYCGPVALCKGEGTSKDVMNKQLALQQKAFDLQQAQLQKINDAFSSYLSGNVGFDPALMSMLQSQFQNQTQGQFNQAGQQVRQGLIARGAAGGNQPVGGDYTRGLVGLNAAKASSLSQGTLGLGIANLQQMLTNKFNAGSLMSGNAATLNSPIATFGSGASNALNQYVQASNSGFGASLSRAFGGALGTGFGKGIIGGLGSVGSGGTFLGGF